MNRPEVFFLDDDPENAAVALCDQDLSFAVLSAAALLSTVNGGPYRFSWLAHPVAMWAEAGLSNYNWLVAYGKRAEQELLIRFDKECRGGDVLHLLEYPAKTLREGGTPFPMLVPSLFDDGKGVVSSNREYYKTRLSKARWTNAKEPDWWMQ